MAVNPTPKTALFGRFRGGILQVVDQWLCPGNVWFVGSTVTGATDAATFGSSPEAPFKTIAYAILQCTADNGDLVIVLPSHVETVIAAATVALSVAGVRIIGVGDGRRRPVVNYTTNAAASFDITAARCTVENIVFTPTGVAAVTAAVNITAADVTIRNCEFELATAVNQAALGILTTAAANRLTVDGCHFHGTNNAGTAAAVRLVGGSDIRITNNIMTGGYTTSKGGLDNITTACVNLVVTGNVINNQTAVSTVCINLAAATTAQIANNRMQILSGTAPIVGAAASWVGGNYYAAVIATAGTLI